MPSIIALQLIWQRHYEVIADDVTGFKQVRWKPKQALAQAVARIESPYDLEARYRNRDGTTWTGYMVHVSETCDDEQCHLLTHIMTTTAAVHEARCTDQIHQALVTKKLPPAEHFVDAAYIDAQLVTQAQRQGIALIGPPRPDTSW